MGKHIRLANEIIRERRESLGISHEEMAAAMGLSAVYYDLEDFDTEVFRCVSLAELLRLCDVLRITPKDIFEGSSSPSEIPPPRSKYPVGGLASLRPLIAAELARTGETVCEFEDRVGWSGMSEFLSGAASGLGWNVYELSCVCDGCGADWLDVLQNEFEAGEWRRVGGSGGEGGNQQPGK